MKRAENTGVPAFSEKKKHHPFHHFPISQGVGPRTVGPDERSSAARSLSPPILLVLGPKSSFLGEDNGAEIVFEQITTVSL